METSYFIDGFSFNDLMQFGIFLIALLTFIYLISH